MDAAEVVGPVAGETHVPRKNRCRFSAIILFLFTASAARAQTVHFVDDSAAGAGTGVSWTDAFTDLQSALDAAAASAGADIIRVAQGTYHPDTTALVDPRDATFALLQNVEILGGFAGVTGVDPDFRDFDALATILSGDIGVAADNTDNCYHVVTAITVDASAILDGFRIRLGNADGGFPENAGAGVLITGNGSPTIRNCRFRFNTASGSGGAVRAINSNSLFENCIFRQNTAASGGGVYNNAVSGGTNAARYVSCRFENNEATSIGGGFYSGEADSVLVDCVFIDNTADFNGGGFNAAFGSPILVNCSFFNNEVITNSGGGVYAANGEILIVNGLFSGNSAAIVGGGVAFQTNAVATVVNSTFANNTAVAAGGGVYASTSTLNLFNTISYFNSVGGTMNEAAQVTLTTVTSTLGNNCIQGLTGALGGVNDIGDDPLFADPDGLDNTIGTEDDDLTLQNASPCIDAGDNTAIPADSTDLNNDGDTAEPTPLDLKNDPRRQDIDPVADSGVGTAPLVDIGAYEANADCDTNGQADVDEIAGNPALDCDSNGILDACETDSDADGVIDPCDACPSDPGNDADGDGVCGDVDICPAFNDPADADADGTPDGCDACPNDPANDADADGVCGDVDACPNDPAKVAAGACGCGVPDTDANGNGIADCLDTAAPPPPPQGQPACGTCAPGVLPAVGMVAPLILLRRRWPKKR